VTIPYAYATSGNDAREEITKILRRLDCDSIGFMDDFQTHELMLAFKHRGRSMQLRASAKGWAVAYLKQNPWLQRSRISHQEWEQRALRQGIIAVNSVLRDWVKGQVMAIECGILSFEAAFLPYMLTNDGTTVAERVARTPELLALPSGEIS
jgi:hypothetical protein